MYSLNVVIVQNERAMDGRQDRLRIKIAQDSRTSITGVCKLPGAVVPHNPSICAGMKVMGCSFCSLSIFCSPLLEAPKVSSTCSALFWRVAGRDSQGILRALAAK